MRPDRIVIGADDPDAIAAMRELYAPVPAQPRAPAGDGHPLGGAHQVRGQRHARHAHLVHERAGAPGREARRRHRARAHRHRLGPAHRLPLPLSGRGLRRLVLPQGRARRCCAPAQENGIDLKVVRAVEEANERQKGVLAEKVAQRFGEDLKGKRFALWGLAFKPNTDDMREAPSRVVIEALARARRHASPPTTRSRWTRRATSTRTSKRVAFADVARWTRVKGADALVDRDRVEGVPQPRLRRARSAASRRR